MRILFMGTPDFASASLKKLYDCGYDVCGVFTQPDKPKNRGMKLEQSPVKKLALEHGTPVFQPQTLRDGSALEIIRTFAPELITVVAYGKILPNDILEYPKYGCVNIHGSLLPKYRGSAPIQWAVLNGEKVTGVTSMYMAEQMDAGDIIASVSTEIGEKETSGELFNRLMVLGAELLCSTLRAIESGRATGTAQDAAAATYAPPIKKELCPIDWQKTGSEILNKVRGLNPWPVATCELSGETFKVYEADALREKTGLTPGKIVFADERGIGIACADGVVTIKTLQAPGKRRMNAADYLRGHKICL